MTVHRVIDILFSLTLALAFFGLILSPLWLAFVPALGPVILAVCMVLDLILGYRVISGHFRPPGHFIPLAYYVVFSVFGLRRFNYGGLRDWWLPALAALVAFHSLCQYAVPAVYRRLARSDHGAAGG
jgi:hypothetical protein